MKYAAWVERTTDDLDPNLHVEIVKSAKEQGFQISRANPAWKRDVGHAVEISSEYRAGYHPIWFWSA